MAQCGRPREDGQPCTQPVRRPGMACRFHGGHGAPASGKRTTATPRTTASPRRSSQAARLGPALPRVPLVPPSSHGQSSWQTLLPATTYQRQSPGSSPAPSRREQERERVKEAAQFCADSLSSGWQEAVADRATEYAQTTWNVCRGPGENVTAKRWHA